MSKLVLGKGLNALIPSSAPAPDGATATETEPQTNTLIPLDQISPNPMQPRSTFDPVRLAELVESIKANGLIQPLVLKKVENGYVIIAGERRFRASKMVGLTEVPAMIMEAADDTRMLELALIENIQRENLNPIELAHAYQKLIDRCGLTQQDLAVRVNKGRSSVTNTLRMLTLPHQIQEMIRDGRLTEGHARAILSLDDVDAQVSFAMRITDHSMTVREAEQKAQITKKRRLIPKRKLPEIAEIESWLKQMLGTSVKITHGLKKGKIEIEYYGDGDLERMLELFRKMAD